MDGRDVDRLVDSHKPGTSIEPASDDRARFGVRRLRRLREADENAMAERRCGRVSARSHLDASWVA